MPEESVGSGATLSNILPAFHSMKQPEPSKSISKPFFKRSVFATPLASFLVHHARRKLALLACLVATCLLSLAALQKDGRIALPGFALVWSHHEVNNSTTASPESPQPLTELGFEADYTYENIGSLDINAYRMDLEQFLSQSFPKNDSEPKNPDSLLNVLHNFVKPPPALNDVSPQQALQQMILLPFLWMMDKHQQFRESRPQVVYKPPLDIPRKVFQTGPHAGPEPPSDKLLPRSWKVHNPEYQYRYYDNQAALDFIDTRFNESQVRQGKGGGIAHTYNLMKAVPVMQSDFWRYAVLASEGGVYSDFDTKCLKAIDEWHRPPWQRRITTFEDEPRPRPAIIVGIEVDVGSRPDWHDWWPRPLGIVQWTIASTRGHPILLDTMKRVVDAVAPKNSTGILEKGVHRNLDSIVEKTGPAPFTDSVLRYLGAKYNATWPALRKLPAEGILFGDDDVTADVLVLSVTAFSPGIGQFGAGEPKSEEALSQHMFAGSWKNNQ